MTKIGTNKFGVALFIVLATILVIILLGEITLKFMASQNRFTHESVNRIQAYYAAKAGMNYALEMLRIGPASGGWFYTSPLSHSCANPAGCLMPTNPNEFPASISSVRIILCDSGAICQGPSGNEGSSFLCQPPTATGINFCVNTSVTYHNQ